jgi:hypothetical protein
MVHAYEGIDRPALGWQYTEGYRRSAPNMPHAHHMQAHLAMRLGRWQEAIDATRMSRRTSLAGFPELDPSHHIDILIRALAHEGRFAEAESEPKAYRDGLPWARLLQLKADGAALEQWAAKRRESNATDGFYIGALAQLDRGDLAAVLPLMANVEEQWKKNPTNIYRYNEVKGRYLVQSGNVDEGLKLLREAAAKAVKDSGLHSWGGGSYQLEVWGEAALRARRWDEAEEAFHEALAHEHGSILGALGMQVVWEQRGRPERARHYADRAAAIWKDADAGALNRQLERPSEARNRLRCPGRSPGMRSRSIAPKGTPRRWFLAACALLAAPVLAAPAPLRSGPQVGERPLPFTSNAVTGLYRGKQHCYVCELKDTPAVLVFARRMDDAPRASSANCATQSRTTGRNSSSGGSSSSAVRALPRDGAGAAGLRVRAREQRYLGPDLRAR